MSGTVNLPTKSPQLKAGEMLLAPTGLPDQAVELEDYARQVIGSAALWQKLVDAVGEELSDQPSAYWVVLVDNPLMALAGAAAIGRHIGRSIQVPMRSSEPRPTPETLLTELKRLDPNERLDGWVAAASALPKVASGESCLLVRAWGVNRPAFADELRDTFTSDSAAPIAVVALVHSADPEQAALFHPGAVLNLTVRQDLVMARTIYGLALPSHQPVASVEDAADLVRRLGLAQDLRDDGILQALNTPEHERFERLAWGLDKQAQRPETINLFNRTVMAREEDHPRHAAVLFLVSHFNRISADQLIALGDILARQTPTAQPPAEAARRPVEITDRVLEECGIKMSVSGRNRAFAFFASKEGGAREEPLGLANAIRDLFTNEAALLKERYLRTLAQAVMIGHPSTKLADDYQELELSALQESAALDATMALERLVRVAFGHPALTGERALDEHENNSIVRSMKLLILRMPAFIARIANTIAAVSANDALGALCTAVPETLDAQRRTLFRRWAAEIFWASYARGITGLTLQGYPGLFDVSSEGPPRRHALVGVLRDALDGTKREPVSQSLQAQIGDSFLGRLLADIGEHFRRILGTDELDIAFLTDAAANFLLAVLRRRPWRDVSMGSAAADLFLAQACLDARTRTWIAEPRDRLAGLEPDPMAYETLRLWRICSAVIEALVGSASFGEAEKLAVNIWLMKAMNLAPIIENISWGYFSNSLAWQGAMQDPADELGELFYQAVRPLLDVLPLIVLMAATRTGKTEEGAPIFTFSEPLRQWFIEPGPLAVDPPLPQLLGMLKAARDFQANWRGAHDNWHISVGAPGRIAKAFKERVEALRAFDLALKPCLEASRRRPPSVRVQGGAAAASTAASPGPADRETKA